jgi:hypothetical protein
MNQDYQNKEDQLKTDMGLFCPTLVVVKRLPLHISELLIGAIRPKVVDFSGKWYENLIRRWACMSKRTLRVLKWLSATPAVGVCTDCGREFKVPMSALTRTADAQANLQEQFDRHRCKSESVK